MGRYITTTAAIVAFVALGVSACGSGDSASSATAPAAIDQSTESATGEARAGDEATTSADADPAPDLATGGSAAPSAPLGLDEIGRSIAVDAGVTIATPNVRQAVDDTLTVVRQSNASVFDATVDIGDTLDDGSVDGSARIVVKVQPTDLDGLIADLDGTAGTLVGRTQTSEDVTNQLVDLDIRIRVERETIERFEKLLTEATTFDDVVSIQRVITERTIELEQLLASQRNTTQRVELSTLTIDLRYVAPVTEVVAEPSTNGIADAFSAGWNAFAGVLFALGLALAVAAPFLLTAALIAAVAWLVTRRRRSTVGAPLTPPVRLTPTPTPARQDEVADGTVGEGEGRPHAGVGHGDR